MYGKALAALAAFGLMTGASAVKAADAPKPSADTITGKVASAKGPEAGVWVIAETTGLPTKFVKIVVTDDQGRYLLPLVALLGLAVGLLLSRLPARWRPAAGGIVLAALLVLQVLALGTIARTYYT